MNKSSRESTQVEVSPDDPMFSQASSSSAFPVLTQEDMKNKRKHRRNATLDQEVFLAKYGQLRDNSVPDADVRVKELLEKLVDLYTQVFDPSIFDEETKKFKNNDATSGLKDKLRALIKMEEEEIC